MSTKRQREAMARFMATVEARKDEMHPEDVDFEPRNFADWVKSCDRGDQAQVKAMHGMVRVSLDRARIGAPNGVYVQLRTHFLDYAFAALQRRFPESQAVQLPDLDIPF